MEELNVTVTDGVKTLELRQGDALPLREPESVKLELSGSLRAPGDFLAKRKDQFKKEKTHVIVDENRGLITLVANDRDEIGVIRITGRIVVHPDFIALGINDPSKVREPRDLATWIKMNRGLFESKEIANKLVGILRNFEATVEKTIEKNEDERANHSKKHQQAVETNLPDTFKVNVPLFVGEPSQTLVIEIAIDPDNLDCILISPDASDLVRRERKAQIDTELKRLVEYAIIQQ